MGRVTVELTGDEQRLLRSLDKVIEKERRLAAEAAKAGEATEMAGRRSEQAFGKRAAGALEKYALGFIGIQAAVSGASALLAKFAEEGKKAAAAIEGSRSGMQRLLQISDSKAEFKANLAAARSFNLATGVGRDKSMQTIFQAMSQGIGDKASLQALSGAASFIDPEVAATAAGKASSAFGKQEVGSVRRIINKILVAAKSSDASFEDMAPALTVFAQGAAKIGASDEESLAALSVLSKVFKSPLTAGERLAALTATVDKKGFGGKGFFGGLEALRSKTRGMSAPKMAEFFGSREAKDAFQAFTTNDAAIAQQLQVIQAEDALAAGKGAIGRKRAALAGSPEFQALLERDRAKAALDEQLASQRGANRLRGEAAVEGLGGIREDGNFILRQIRSGAGSLAVNADLSPGSVEAVGEGAESTATLLSRLNPMTALLEYNARAVSLLSRIAGNSKETADRTGSPNLAPPGPAGDPGGN